MPMGIDQLAAFYVLPALFALLNAAGFVLALVFWRRSPKACSWVAMGCAINFVITVSRVGFTMTWFRIVNDREIFNYVIFGLGFLNIVGNAMLLVAAFTGRNEPTRPYPPVMSRLDSDDDWEPQPKKPQPPNTGPGEVGIKAS